MLTTHMRIIAPAEDGSPIENKVLNVVVASLDPHHAMTATRNVILELNMAVPQPARFQTVEEIAVFLTAAICLKKPLSAIYNNHRRSLCPHILGRNKSGDLQVLCYQFAGSSASGLQPPGSPDNWRCIVLAKLKSVSLLEGAWHTAEIHSRPQKCIEEILFDAEKLPS